MNIFLVIVVTSLLHSIAEGVAVYLLTPVIIENSTTAALVAGEIALGGTFVHHYIDSAITAPILLALSRAGLVKKPYFVK